MMDDFNGLERGSISWNWIEPYFYSHYRRSEVADSWHHQIVAVHIFVDQRLEKHFLPCFLAQQQLLVL